MIAPNQLKAFLTVVEAGSMSKAAKKLFCSQSTISRLIEQLEDETGLSLFDRSFTSKRLTLTEHGQIIQLRCKQTLDIFNELESFCHGLSTGVEPELTIALPQLFDKKQTKQLVAKLVSQFPTTQFSFVEPSVNRIISLIERGKVDFALNIMTMEYGNGITSLGLGTIPACFVCHPEHPLANKEIIDLQVLESYRQIAFSMPVGQRNKEELNFSRTIIEAETIQQHLLLVNAGVGYALVPEVIYLNNKDEYDLVKLETELDRRLVYAYHALYPQANHTKSINHWLCEYLKVQWQQ
ncbi:LysR family transcriptional regulator [Photobacterium frigidiphilum]|nr:LysR family transcriptional regulator [Photobacterium frigidiphilum]